VVTNLIISTRSPIVHQNNHELNVSDPFDVTRVLSVYILYCTFALALALALPLPLLLRYPVTH